jgi:hypothetical protein
MITKVRTFRIIDLIIHHEELSLSAFRINEMINADKNIMRGIIIPINLLKFRKNLAFNKLTPTKT